MSILIPSRSWAWRKIEVGANMYGLTFGQYLNPESSYINLQQPISVVGDFVPGQTGCAHFVTTFVLTLSPLWDGENSWHLLFSSRQQHRSTGNSSSRRLNVLFWSLWAPAFMHRRTHTWKIKINLYFFKQPHNYVQTICLSLNKATMIRGPVRLWI